MKLRGILSAAAVLLASAALSITAGAATVEDVYAAMAEAGMPASFIQDVKNQFPHTVHDENGMEMNGEYRSYGEWVTVIRENGAKYVWGTIADEMGVSAEDIMQYYENKQADEPGEPYAPTVEPEKPFAQMTLEEKRAYVDALPESERAEFLANLTPEERTSILKQLDPEQKQNVISGMVELGQQMGMTVTVDDTESFKFSIRDQSGTLIDATSFSLSVDPTGWNTTVPVLLSTGMIALGAGGLILLTFRKKEENSNG